MVTIRRFRHQLQHQLQQGALRTLAATAAISAVACAPLASPIEVEVISNASGGDYELAVETLTSAVDLGTGRGQDFDILGGVKIPGNETLNTTREFDLYPTFESVVEKNRELSGGGPVAPRLSVTDGVVRGLDFDSLLYLTIFRNFERVFTYYRDVVGDESGATQNFAIVGFYSEIVAASAFPVPLIAADNAAYFSRADGWLTLRISDVESVPLSMNAGVIAHEFSHRLFFYRVFRSSEVLFDMWRIYSSDISPSNATVRAQNMISAIDEGIADLHAVAFTRNINFIAASVETVPEVGELRNPEGAFATAATYAILDSETQLSDSGVGCTGTDLSSSGFNFYCLGTVMLRALWDGAGRDYDVLEDVIVPAVGRALPHVGDRMVAETSGSEAIDFEIEYFLEAVANELDGAVQSRVCDAFALKFAGQMLEGRIPSCL